MVSSVRPISAAGSCRPITRSPRRAIRCDVQRWPSKSGSAAAEKRPPLPPPPSRNLLRLTNRGADRGRIRRRRRNRVRLRETHLAECKSAFVNDLAHYPASGFVIGADISPWLSAVIVTKLLKQKCRKSAH